MPTHPFRHPYRVTYADCTVGNHVYYGRYLAWLEAARGELFRHVGTPFAQWQNDQISFPVIECHLHYRRQARYDDALMIDLWVAELRRARLTFAYRILNQDHLPILEATTVHACQSAAAKPQRLPEALVSLLAPYCDQAAEASEPV